MPEETNPKKTTGTDTRDTSTDVSDADRERGEDAAAEAHGGTGEEPSEEREAGDSRPVSPTAPASGGELLGSEGTVDPGGDGPDVRPVDTEGGETPEGTGETPVPSPTGGADTGQEVRTGSAGAASVDAGSEGPHEKPEIQAMEDTRGNEERGEERGREEGGREEGGRKEGGQGASTERTE